VEEALQSLTGVPVMELLKHGSTISVYPHRRYQVAPRGSAEGEDANNLSVEQPTPIRNGHPPYRVDMLSITSFQSSTHILPRVRPLIPGLTTSGRSCSLWFITASPPPLPVAIQVTHRR
jgi:hypothetical protein